MLHIKSFGVWLFSPLNKCESIIFCLTWCCVLHQRLSECPQPTNVHLKRSCVFVSPTHLHICNFKWDRFLWIILYLHCSFCKLTKKKSQSPYGSLFVPMPLFTSTPIRYRFFFPLTPKNLTWRQRHWRSFPPPITEHVCVHSSIPILTGLSSSQYQHARYTCSHLHSVYYPLMLFVTLHLSNQILTVSQYSYRRH